MRDLENLIRFERENSAVDLKATAYAKNQNEALLKDLIALGNAEVSGDRFIVMGVKEFPDGKRELRGIAPDGLRDAATYQQLVRENVEPDLHLEVHPAELDGKLFGIIRIHDCTEAPYLMRKAYGELQRGEGWTRVGTHQPRLTRRDLDRIYAEQQQRAGFSDEVAITFLGSGSPTELTLRSAGDVALPSEVAEARIREILLNREQHGESPWCGMGYQIGGTPYEARTTAHLRKDLADLKTDYRDRDAFALFGEYAHEVGIQLLNMGTSHLEDALLILKIPKIPGIEVADTIYVEPTYGRFGMRTNYLIGDHDYPDVKETSTLFVVRSEVGDLRHRVPTNAFGDPLRISVFGPAEGKSVVMEAALHGKNLKNPIVQELVIKVLGGGTWGVGSVT